MIGHMGGGGGGEGEEYEQGRKDTEQMERLKLRQLVESGAPQKDSKDIQSREAGFLGKLFGKAARMIGHMGGGGGEQEEYEGRKDTEQMERLKLRQLVESGNNLEAPQKDLEDVKSREAGFLGKLFGKAAHMIGHMGGGGEGGEQEEEYGRKDTEQMERLK